MYDRPYNILRKKWNSRKSCTKEDKEVRVKDEVPDQIKMNVRNKYARQMEKL
jgi:hypothetical protein